MGNKPLFSFDGKTALVTGSSSGIGRAIAGALADAGADVLQHGLEQEAVEPLEDTAYRAADLTDAPSRDVLMEWAFQKSPELSLLVCNAGTIQNAPFLEMTEERWDKTMELNLKANYFLAQAFARRLVAEDRKGAILFTGSVNGFQAERRSTAYDVSKGGIAMMTRGLAMDLGDHGIRVNAIAPGLIYTNTSRPGFERNPDKREHFERKILLRRIGEPEDCAGAAVFLLSPAANYVTGEIIVIDGGLTVSQIGDMP